MSKRPDFIGFRPSAFGRRTIHHGGPRGTTDERQNEFFAHHQSLREDTKHNNVSSPWPSVALRGEKHDGDFHSGVWTLPGVGRLDDSHRGFSLIEVLIAVALLMVLSGAMFGFVTDLLNTRERIEMFTMRQRAVNTFFERLEADLACTIVGHARFGAGIDGEANRLRLLTRAVAVQHAADASQNAFATLGDLQRAEFEFDESRHVLRARRTAASEIENSADLEEIGRSIFRVRFRYHNGSDWQDRFDSREQNRFPLAIEVAVWFEPGPDEQWAEEPDEVVEGEDDEPERLTFDAERTFDEFEWAMRADRDFRAQRRPDRVRVITIPDAREETFDSPVDEEMF